MLARLMTPRILGRAHVGPMVALGHLRPEDVNPAPPSYSFALIQVRGLLQSASSLQEEHGASRCAREGWTDHRLLAARRMGGPSIVGCEVSAGEDDKSGMQTFVGTVPRARLSETPTA